MESPTNTPNGNAAATEVARRLQLGPTGQANPEQLLALLVGVDSLLNQLSEMLPTLRQMRLQTGHPSLDEAVRSWIDVTNMAVVAMRTGLANYTSSAGISSADLQAVAGGFAADVEALLAGLPASDSGLH